MLWCRSTPTVLSPRVSGLWKLASGRRRGARSSRSSRNCWHFPHPQSPEGFLAQVDAILGADTTDRLSEIAVPTLVMSGALDILAPQHLGRAIAEGIPAADFEVQPESAHQALQEIADEWNTRVDAFWREVEAGA
jgi:pimeloyl-ACP methyl ester carboxylesterase